MLLNLLETILATMFTLFLPGFFLSLAIFRKGEISYVERFILSFVFSIALIPLFLFYISILGISIRPLILIFVVLAVIVLSIAVITGRSFVRIKNRKKETSKIKSVN